MKKSFRTIGAAMIVFAATACGNGNGKGAANVAETQEEALPKVSVVG